MGETALFTTLASQHSGSIVQRFLLNTTAPKQRTKSVVNPLQCSIAASFQQLWLYQLYSLNHLY